MSGRRSSDSPSGLSWLVAAQEPERLEAVVSGENPPTIFSYERASEDEFRLVGQIAAIFGRNTGFIDHCESPSEGYPTPSRRWGIQRMLEKSRSHYAGFAQENFYSVGHGAGYIAPRTLDCDL